MTSGAARTGQPQPGRRAAAYLIAAVAALAVAGCDSRGSTSPPQPSPVGASTSPGASMTEVVDAAQCAMRRDLGTDTTAELPFRDLFGKGVARGVDVNDEFTPGPDAAGDPRCSKGPLPDGGAAWCGQPAPWLSADWTDMVGAFGADRIRRISLSADEGKDADGRVQGRTFSYVEIEVRQGDARGTNAFLEGAFKACADAAPGTVGGITVMAGSVPSARGPQGEARTVAFLTPDRAAWVILDGREWTKAERGRALDAIAAHLA